MTSFAMLLQNLICFTLFFLGFPRRSHFAARFLALCVPTAGLLYCISGLLNQGKLSTLTYFLVEFGLLLVLFHLCFQTSWEQALYSASAGRATQHLIYSLLNLIRLRVSFLIEWQPENVFLSFVVSALSWLPFCLIIYLLLARNMDTSHYNKADFRRHMNLLSVMILFVCIGITRFAKDNVVYDINSFIARNLYAITCCLLCLIMQSELCKRARLATEMEMVRMLWKEDSKQLAERKDTIELINMKCHDIRHRLEDCRLPLTTSEEKEIEALIRIYDQTYRTGNQTLDVLLTDRALLCEKNHIQLSFLGDGGCLAFLTESEVYSLFGNALGNAIEASCEVAEEKRQISIIIQSSGELISINVTNYYQGRLHFEDGLPVTAHPGSQDFHGYGMKSMRTIAKRHGGEIKVKAEDGVFVLTIWLINSITPPEE